MENVKSCIVLVDIENIDGEDTPIIEQQFLEEQDIDANYEWVDEEKTIMKRKDFII